MLYAVELRALSMLTGDYGWPPPGRRRTVHPGDLFTTDNEKAEQFEALGLAERNLPRPEPKMWHPPENRMMPRHEDKAFEPRFELEPVKESAQVVALIQSHQPAHGRRRKRPR